MRVLFPALLVVVTACGGKSATPATPANAATDPASTTTTTTSTPAPPVTGPGAAKDDLATLCATRPEEFGPVQLSVEQASRRHGLQAKTFADAPSSKDRPIEVCGIPEQRQWLMQTSCADGSKPYKSPRDVSASRQGNVGAGGRCGSIVDLYIAKCPEAQYDVYMDMYMCPEGQSVF